MVECYQYYCSLKTGKQAHVLQICTQNFIINRLADFPIHETGEKRKKKRFALIAKQAFVTLIWFERVNYFVNKKEVINLVST